MDLYSLSMMWALSSIRPPVCLQLWQNKYSADFQGCFEDDRAFLIIILCTILIPLGLYFLKLGLVIEFGQHMSELLLKEGRKGQIQCFGPRVYRVYRVSQKRTQYSSFLAITTLWKGLGRKVGCVLKNSGNSLSDIRHQNFSISLLEAEKIGSKDDLKNLEKNWCLSNREFPEFFKNGPTFYSCSTQ